MPFKLKLKKSRHYNVTSKSLFVIPVHHLLGKSHEKIKHKNEPIQYAKEQKRREETKTIRCTHAK